MRRVLLTSALIGVFSLLAAGPAVAAQCPKLVQQINAAAGNRFDAAAHDARQKAAQAQKLHGENKHADSEKAAKEGLALLGVK